MKVGINTLFYIPGEVGGSETYLLEILREWRRQPTGCEFVLFTNMENHGFLEQEFSGDRWSFVLCPFRAENRFVRILREQIELPRKLKKAGVEVLWSPGYTAPLVTGCHQVVTLHDMQYKTFPQDLSFIARMTTAFLVHFGVKACDKVIAISEFSKSEICRYTPAEEQQVVVVLEGVSPEFTSRKGDGNIRQGDPYILCVANTYPHKHVDQLVRAFAQIESEIPHQLVIVGRPRLGEPAFLEALQLVSQPERVERKSGLSRSELVDTYRQADLFVFPSQYEGFGLPVLEALKAGVPVVTTRCGAIPEVGGEFVVYYNHQDDRALANAILETLPSSDQKNSESDSSADWIRRFSWPECAERTLEIIQTCPESA